MQVCSGRPAIPIIAEPNAFRAKAILSPSFFKALSSKPDTQSAAIKTLGNQLLLRLTKGGNGFVEVLPGMSG